MRIRRKGWRFGGAVKNGRATVTIALLTARILIVRQIVTLVLAAYLVVAAVQGSPMHLSAAWMALLAVGFGSQDRDALSNNPNLRWILLSAPLYGRELARAVALAPAIFAAIFGLALGFVTAPNDARLQWMIAAACGAIATTLIGLSSTVRSGKDRLVFVTSAALAGFGIAYIGTLGGPMTTAASVVLAAVGSYFALRAFGETFARLDLVD